MHWAIRCRRRKTHRIVTPAPPRRTPYQPFRARTVVSRTAGRRWLPDRYRTDRRLLFQPSKTVCLPDATELSPGFHRQSLTKGVLHGPGQHIHRRPAIAGLAHLGLQQHVLPQPGLEEAAPVGVDLLFDP